VNDAFSTEFVFPIAKLPPPLPDLAAKGYAEHKKETRSKEEMIRI
jgi:hypothetical protein